MTRLTPEQMHAMVRAFTAHHLEGAKDEVGPNKQTHHSSVGYQRASL